jgi:hypothetical protein
MAASLIAGDDSLYAACENSAVLRITCMPAKMVYAGSEIGKASGAIAQQFVCVYN